MNAYLATIRFEADDDSEAAALAIYMAEQVDDDRRAVVESVENRSVFTNPSESLPPAVMEELRQMMREEAAAAVRDHERAFMPHIRSHPAASPSPPQPVP